MGFCNETYLPTRRGFDTFHGFYTGAQDYYMHTRAVSGIFMAVSDTYQLQNILLFKVGKGPAGYDFRSNEEVDLKANQTYSSVSTYLEVRRSIQNTLSVFPLVFDCPTCP